jgi:tetratricopeptide (TPR) repeat protein
VIDVILPGNSLVLQDMKRIRVILPIAFGLLLLVACRGPNSENGNSEAAGEPKPQTSLEWANHGTRLLNKGLPEQALASYDNALLLDATNPYTYCSKASAYHKLGQPELALQNADKALQVDPGYAPAMANKSLALRKLGREAEADSLLKSAFAIDSGLKRHFRE